MSQKGDDSRSLLVVYTHTVILAFITVWSLGGNSLVCLALYRNRRLRTVTNLLLLSLAVADLMTGIFVFPFATIASGLRRWPFSDAFCQFTGFLTTYWAMVSLSILALTSINRYLCVVKPQQYQSFYTKGKTLASIIFVWIFMFAFYLTLVFAVHISYKWNPNALHCMLAFRDEDTKKGAYISFALFSFVSMSFVLFGYCRVYRVVWQHNNAVVPFIQETNNQAVSRALEIKTTRVLLAAVFGFCVAWIPSNAINVLQFGFEIFLSSVVQSMPMLFACTSAWINPIIYGVMNRAIRKEFKNILLCCKKSRDS